MAVTFYSNNLIAKGFHHFWSYTVSLSSQTITADWT